MLTVRLFILLGVVSVIFGLAIACTVEPAATPSVPVASAITRAPAALPTTAPTPTPEPTPTPKPTATATTPPTPTPSPTDTPLPTTTPAPTVTPELTATPNPTIIPAPTPTIGQTNTGGKISGVVLSRDGEPLSGIGLWAWQGSRDNSGFAETDGEGTFEIEVPAGSFTIDVYAGAGCSFVGWYNLGSITTIQEEAQRIVLTDQDVEGVEIALPDHPVKLKHVAWCAPEPTPIVVTPPGIAGYDGCQVISPPDELGVDPFYAKYCDANGIPVLSSTNVPDLALLQAWNTIMNMLVTRPDLHEAIASNGVRFGVIGVDEVTTDMPEYADLYEAFPDTDWDVRARGLGPTRQRPLASSAEENLLCYADDVYLGESITVHEFAHAIDRMGLRSVEPDFGVKLDALYAEAMATGLWLDTYAAENAQEYWAEGVQSYFSTNLESQPGIHNHINTHDELLEYDPGLYELIAGVFKNLRWTPGCPESA